MTAPSDLHGLIERVEATIHQINGHWWNRRNRPSAPDIRALLDALERLSAPTDTGGEMALAPPRVDALGRAFCLLDSFAGDGLVHVYGNGQTIDATDVCGEICRAFGIEPEPGWWRAVATMIAAAPATAEPKPMTGDDVLRVFKPLPPEEAEVFRQFIGHADDDDPAPATADTGDVGEVERLRQIVAAVPVSAMVGKFGWRTHAEALDGLLGALRFTPQQGER